MSNTINNIDMTAAAAGLSKTSPNNQAIAGQAHTLKMVTYANASAALDNISPNLSLPVIPAPLGTKTPDETQVVAEKLASKLAPFATKNKSAEEAIADPDVQATLAGQVPSLGQQQSNIAANASGSLELMLQMMALTSPSKAIKAMMQSMDAQQASIKSQSAKSIKNLEKYYKNQEAAEAKGETAKIFGWIASAATLVIGAVLIFTGVGVVAGALMVTAGALMLANQAYKTWAPEKFQKSDTGKIIGTTLVIAAAIASVAAAIVTGGASVYAMGFALVSVLGTLLTTSVQVIETWDKNFAKDHPELAMGLMIAGAVLSVGGGIGSAGAAARAAAKGAAAVAEDGATIAEDAAATSGKMASLKNAVKESRVAKTFIKFTNLAKKASDYKPSKMATLSESSAKAVNYTAKAGTVAQSGSSITSDGIKIDAAKDTETGQIFKADSQKIDADIQNIKAFQDQLNQSISSVTEFVNTLNTMVADLSQAQLQSFNQTSRLV